MGVSAQQLKAFIADAADHFATPDEVLSHAQLSDDEKRKILESWKVEEEELMTATEENMGSSDSNVLSQVNKALQKLS